MADLARGCGGLWKACDDLSDFVENEFPKPDSNALAAHLAGEAVCMFYPEGKLFKKCGQVFGPPRPSMGLT